MLVDPPEVDSLGVDAGEPDVGVFGFLGLKNLVTESANWFNGFFLGDVVLPGVLGVALLPSPVTPPSVGPESDSVDTGG